MKNSSHECDFPFTLEYYDMLNNVRAIRVHEQNLIIPTNDQRLLRTVSQN